MKKPKSTKARVADATSTAQCSYWLEDIAHNGRAAFNPDPANYKVFRNVKDYGAKGDGVNDDTAAINAAISAGGRCAPGSCQSTTTTPAIVYFPSGTYMISSSIIDYYYTQIIGNPNCLPTIKAFANFGGSGFGLIDGDPYVNGNLAYGATNVFWRQIRNLILDTTLIPARNAATGIHWPTAQATSLQNIVFNLNPNAGTVHVGLFIESGSGGFMNDLVSYGGDIGFNMGCQQFTMRNITAHNANIAINQIWDWGWTYQGVSVYNCSIGFDMSSPGGATQSVGSVTILDSSMTKTGIGIRTAYGPGSLPIAGGSLIVENVQLQNVPIAIQGKNGNTALAGTASGSMHIDAWGEGQSWVPPSPSRIARSIKPVNRPSSLVLPGGRYYYRSKPQYNFRAVSGVVSARAQGATGDGKTDDTAALQKAINTAKNQNKLLFVDHGTYLVTGTIYIPAGSKIVGEAYSVIMSSGAFFNDLNNPHPVVQIGKNGEKGSIEWSDMIVSTRGQQMGATLFQYNLASPSSSPSGLWDVHSRIGGFAGSELQLADCPTTPHINVTASKLNQQCIAAFMSMHITKPATGLYLENVWLWTADHDVEDPYLTQITVYAGRGLLDESTNGPVWMVGTAVEHHTKYQYTFVNTKNVYAGQIQTETPYYQPNPGASIPFPYRADLCDPQFPTMTNVSVANYTIPQVDAWGLRIVDSKSVGIYGAGLYSFFDNYSTDCSSLSASGAEICQNSIFQFKGGNEAQVTVYNLNTVGTYHQFQRNGAEKAIWSKNANGFVDTIALWRSA